jgi:hypothetical protein
VANYAYLSLWFRDFNIEKGLTHLEKALAHFPVSAQQPGLPAGQAGFRLVVRSLDPGQSPSLEADLLATPADVRAAAAEFLHDDTTYEVTANWELWLPRGEASWEQAPSPVEFLLAGEKFDAARYGEAGHLQVNLGPEQLYLGLSDRAPETWLRPVRENARRLYAFLRSLHEELPLAESRLWSEGEPDFGARSQQLLSGAAAPPGQDPRP